MKDRAYGCMFGALIGDSVGSYNQYTSIGVLCDDEN